MVCVDNWMWVPLLRVQPGEYEVISLAEEGKHVYTRLDNSRIQNGLHEALGRHWGDGGVTAIDRELATETLRAYGELQLDSAVMRCKLYSLLLPAYTILGDEERQKSVDRNDRLVLTLDPCGAVVGIITTYALWLYG